MTAYSIGSPQGGPGLYYGGWRGYEAGTGSLGTSNSMIPFPRACAKAIESISNRPISAGRSGKHRRQGHYFSLIICDPVVPALRPRRYARGAGGFPGRPVHRFTISGTQEKAPPKRRESGAKVHRIVLCGLSLPRRRGRAQGGQSYPLMSPGVASQFGWHS